MIAKEGIPFVAMFLIPAAIFSALTMWVGTSVCLTLAGYMAFFFRDPERRPPADDGVVVSPADGRVVMVAPVEAEAKEPATQVSIFLSPFDVHINRSPIGGQVTGIVHRQGAFHIASRDIASVENEQNIVTIRGQHLTVAFRQIAGVLARRLVLWKKEGDRVCLGERVGLMKFGSRIDVLMPGEVAVLIRQGERVTGGVTVIGRVRNELLGQPGETDV